MNFKGGLAVGFLSSISDAVNGTIDFIAEKKKKFVKTNRIKRYIKRETNTLIKGYIALGKHYYSELRDVPNKEMQRVCKLIDASRCEIKKLKNKLHEINYDCDVKCYCDVLDGEDFCRSEGVCNPCTECSDSPCGTDAVDYCCSCGEVCDCSDSTECCEDNCCESSNDSKESK